MRHKQKPANALPGHRSPSDAQMPLILVEKEQGALRIKAMDRHAAAHSLTIGMALTQARAIAPHIQIATAEPQKDADYLRDCALACEIFTPLVAVWRKDGLLLDVTGCEHLFGGEKKLVAYARQRLRRLGLEVRTAFANTPHAAWALARFAHETPHPSLATVESEHDINGEVVFTPTLSEMEKRLLALPIHSLEAGKAVLIALSRAGFRVLGDLAKRPSHLLTARFGADLVTTLKRILGQEDSRITPLRPAPPILAEAVFPEPLTQMGALLTALETLANRIGSELEQNARGGRQFEASFFRSDGAVRRLQIETAQATRNVASLMRLFALKIETLADPIDPGFGFDFIRLGVTRSEVLTQTQPRLSSQAGIRADLRSDSPPFHAPDHAPDRQNDADELAALIDRLVVRFGRDAVRRFVAHETHDPARAGTTTPYLNPVSSGTGSPPEPGQPPRRPLQFLPHPQPIDILAKSADSPQASFRWRRVVHTIIRAEGPERIAPEWWRHHEWHDDKSPATRDYYRVEDQDGYRFWIFREMDADLDFENLPREKSGPLSHWFIHGLFA